MLILDATDETIQVLLGGAGALPVNSSWVHMAAGTAFTPGETSTVTNGATPVTIVPAPSSGYQQQCKFISILNDSGGSVAATVRYNKTAGSITRKIITVTLTNGDALQYADGHGFTVIDSSGAIKSAFSLPTPTSGTATISGSNTSVTVALTGVTKVVITPVKSTAGFTPWSVEYGTNQFIIHVPSAPEIESGDSKTFTFDWERQQ